MTQFKFDEWTIDIDSISCKPKEAMLEVTMECNLNCRYCFRRATSEVFGVMDERLYEKVLESLSKAGVSKIVFSGWGEPLTHRRILDFIGLAKEYKFKIILNTNGTLLESYGYDIVKLGVDEVVVSIDALTKDIYEELRVGGEVESVIRGLKTLTEARRKFMKPMILGFNFTVTRLNYRELPNILKLAYEFKASYIRLSNMIPLNDDLRELSCLEDSKCIEEVEKQLNTIGMLVLDLNIDVYRVNFKIKAQRTCPFMLNKALYIRWDGGIAPCLHYAHTYTMALYGVRREIKSVTFGDVKLKNILDIWRDEEYVKFRFRTKLGYLPSCLDCDLVDYCVYTMSNDMDCWGNSPTCAHCPFLYNLSSCPL